MSESPLPFFTIGHSTRLIEAFVDLLRLGSVVMVVDVRSVPRSRHNPQYNEDVLASELAPYQIGYTRIGGLGGLRPRSPDVPRELNAYWQNDSFHNYADYALSAEFAESLDSLVGLGGEKRCAIMCAEAVWWRCHRRIVADYLIARGRDVFHLMGEDRINPARLTPGADPRPDGTIHYPAP